MLCVITVWDHLKMKEMFLILKITKIDFEWAWESEKGHEVNIPMADNEPFQLHNRD